MKSKNSFAILLAILAAIFYAFSIPLSSLLLVEIPSTLLAGLLYLGAGSGMSIVYAIKNIIDKKTKTNPIERDYEVMTKKDLKYIIAMIILDAIAPILLLLAIDKTASSTVSLLNNFEIVATSVIAFLIFKEKMNGRLLISIILITIASIILSVDFREGLSFSVGALFALLACLCWGFENNCTKNLATKNPFLVVIIKGFGSGLTSFMIGLILGNKIGKVSYVFYALLLGFISYGLSVFTYVLAQKQIGASRTSCYYGFAPFIGVLLSFLILKEKINISFAIALAIMLIGVIILTVDTIKQEKKKI